MNICTYLIHQYTMNHYTWLPVCFNWVIKASIVMMLKIARSFHIYFHTWWQDIGPEPEKGRRNLTKNMINLQYCQSWWCMFYADTRWLFIPPYHHVLFTTSWQRCYIPLWSHGHWLKTSEPCNLHINHVVVTEILKDKWC